MKLSLHIPSLREMDYRQALLAQPETMSYNAGQPSDAPGYDVATGCIDFPITDWRYWRGVWLYREPACYDAYLLDEEIGAFVGEVCYYYDMERDACGAGVLIEHDKRGRGYGTAGLKLLVRHAFARPEIDALFVDLPEHRDHALRMFLTAGFREVQTEGGIIHLRVERNNL